MREMNSPTGSATRSLPNSAAAGGSALGCPPWWTTWTTSGKTLIRGCRTLPPCSPSGPASATDEDEDEDEELRVHISGDWQPPAVTADVLYTALEVLSDAAPATWRNTAGRSGYQARARTTGPSSAGCPGSPGRRTRTGDANSLARARTSHGPRRRTLAQPAEQRRGDGPAPGDQGCPWTPGDGRGRAGQAARRATRT